MTKLVPPPIRRLTRRIGFRGIFLVFWGLLWINSGFQWVKDPPVSDNYYLLHRVFTPNVWGDIFIAFGFVIGLGAIWKKIEDYSYSAAAWVGGILALALAGCWLPGVPGPEPNGGRALGTYILYICFVLIMSRWPEPPLGDAGKLDERSSENPGS